MATGFTSRWNGKVLAKLLGVGSGGLTAYGATNASNPNVSANDLAALKGFGTLNGVASTAALSVANSGITKLSSVGGSTYALAAPTPGRYATIYTDAIGDGARKVSSTAAGATFLSTLAGAGFLNFSTTILQSIELLGLSTSQWLVQGNVGSVSVSTS